MDSFMDGNFLIEDEMEVVKFVSKCLLYEHGSDMLRRIWDLVPGLIACKTLMNIFLLLVVGQKLFIKYREWNFVT